ncbi:MAG: hypothetical protein RMX68_026080 [Aulosira sp. ZfuVER01]|nr:hypothetical protein [Aulosira sp. ZfuVER01]MDZ7999454.1 hypothetical protein [Aulosira sp. DedVER01a]MDZ8054767.1 hypothetical protein [Aulosira sp. ZfuCHP01]
MGVGRCIVVDENDFSQESREQARRFDRLGNFHWLKSGERAIAIGNPVTRGVVSVK